MFYRYAYRRRARLISIVVGCSLFLLVTVRCHAQTPDSSSALPDEVFSIGIYGGYARHILVGSFAIGQGAVLSESSDCGRFEHGNGGSPLVGMVAEAPFSSHAAAGLSIDYSARSGMFRFGCIDPAFTRLPDGSVVRALTDHVADVRYHAITSRLSFLYRPFDIDLRFSVGPSLTIVLPDRYSGWEEIVTPVNAEFLEGGQVRQNGSASFTDGTSLSVGIAASASYRAAIGDRLSLVPEVGGILGLTDDIASIGVRAHRLTATLGLVYRIYSNDDALPPAPAPEVPPLTAELHVEGLNDDGTTADTLYMEERREISTRLRPLLNYIFFDRGDSTLPDRYRMRTRVETENFSIDNLKQEGTLGIYYNVLDIVGWRLHHNHHASITLTGTQPELPASPLENHKLARGRATVVKQYLVQNWGIDSDRISILTRRDPLTATNPDTEEGAVENRRVEIASSDYEIISPVIFNDTLHLYTMPRIRISPRASSPYKIARTSIRTRSNDTLISIRESEFNVEGAIPRHLGQETSRATTGTSLTSGQIHYTMTVEDSAGRSRTVVASLPVQRIAPLNNLRFGSGSYSLILFDFNSALLRSEHLRTLSLVNERAGSHATASVFGYTDILGTDDLNLTLSTQRARSVAAGLQATVNGVNGRGETALLYDNSLPEGRFYSRSVTIEVTLPPSDGK